MGLGLPTDEEIRRRRGGGGKPRITESKQMYLILNNLEPEEYMNKNYPGHHLAEISRICYLRDGKLLDRLEDGGFITSRPGRPDERGNKYYYRTTAGLQFRELLSKLG